jgi:hypothetical protein
LEDGLQNGDLTTNLLGDAAVFLEIIYAPEASNRSIVDSQSTEFACKETE